MALTWLQRLESVYSVQNQQLTSNAQNRLGVDEYLVPPEKGAPSPPSRQRGPAADACSRIQARIETDGILLAVEKVCQRNTCAWSAGQLSCQQQVDNN
jgi:hypothetical protein